MRFLNLSALFLVGSSLLALPLTAQDKPTLPVAWEVKEGLSAPESAYYDAATKMIYVSNIDGEGAKKDGQGWISKLDPSGKMVAAQWVTGLNAPKGIRVTGAMLWVSDIDELVGINIKEGKIQQRVKVPDAKFLNDVAAGPDGSVYVSDLLTSTVYVLKEGMLSVLASGEQLESPNGLLVNGDKLILGGWGLPVGGFSPTTMGRLLSLDLKSKKVTPITDKPLGNLDGVELDGKGGYVVTDWAAGKIFHVTADGHSKLIWQHEKGVADHSYLPGEQLLIVPLMMDNKVVALKWKP
jgi:DNA-binding beta-propeller fold protein YncE